jgi:hypothetical protein
MSGMTDPPAIRALQPYWFAYSPDRRGENPRQHLKHYKGALQADAFAGFQQLYEGGAINEVACWAHARRKFHEIHIAHASPATTEAIERIAALYAIEAEIRGSTPEARRSARQARAKPLLDSMRTWMEDTLAKLSRKSDTAAAIRYVTSRWQALTRYVDDGHLEIDNNAAERALRVVALGRKNYLFCKRPSNPPVSWRRFVMNSGHECGSRSVGRSSQPWGDRGAGGGVWGERDGTC